MISFKLNYGDYIFSEFGVRLTVTPFFVVSGFELNMAQAIKKNVVRKVAKGNDYTTTADGIRLLINTQENGATEVANIVLKLGEKSGVTHANLYPKRISNICFESNFFFAGEDVSVLSTMKELSKLYPKGLLDKLETISPVTLLNGYNMCSKLSEVKTNNRFSR